MEQTGNPTWPTAKISPPPVRTHAGRRVIVSRPRLLAPLNDAVRAGRVTLVVAPGGAGKTSLLADWAQQAPLPVAWYALDALDCDSHRLMRGICAAVERALPGAAERALAALDAGAQAAAAGLLLGALEGEPCALVLDDFQHLDDHPDTVALWDHLLRFRPPTLSLVILSRSVPLMGFAALAAMDELHGLGRSDLSFDAREAEELLAAHGHDCTTDEAAQMAARSGGWATGLLLIARAAPGGVRVMRARVDAFMEHLGAELLAALPDKLRRFMMESAVLGAATPAMADAVLSRRDSAALYAEVAARDLFIEEHDDSYRYHDLFAEYLTGILARDDSDRLAAIRHTAACWWREHDDIPRALALLAANEEWAELAASLERDHRLLWTRGLWGTIVTYVESMPLEYRTPRLLTQCGRARSQRGEFAEAIALADSAMAAASGEEEWLEPAFLHVQALLQSRRFNDIERSVDAPLTVAERLGRTSLAVRLMESRGIARFHLGRLEDGRRDLLAALTAHREAGDETLEALALFYLATQLAECGHASEAAGYLDRAEALWRRLDNQPMLGDVLNSRALIHTLHGDLDAARDAASAAMAMAREIGYPLLECAASATLATVLADGGDAALIERHAGAALELSARLDDPDSFNEVGRARIAAALLRRDRAGARALIDEARTRQGSVIDGALLDLLEGQLALRSRAFAGAASLLDGAATRLDAVGRPHGAARARLLCAEALLETGSIRQAEEMLNRMAATAPALGCAGYLRPAARLARKTLAARRVLRRLRRTTRQLLDDLATTVPQLVVVAPSEAADRTAPLLRLSPFGDGRIVLEGRDLDPTALPPKARELLFYAAHAGRPLRRDELLDALWDADTRAEQALWDASRHLRRLLGEDSWGPRGGRYALRLTLCHDGWEVERAASEALDEGRATLERLAAAERALELIGAGGYLEWCDGVWAVAERERTRRQAVAVALTGAALYETMGRMGDAITACRRAVAFNPYDEEAQRVLLHHLIAAGQTAAARDAYRAYRRLLRQELEAEPSRELRALAHELGSMD